MEKAAHNKRGKASLRLQLTKMPLASKPVILKKTEQDNSRPKLVPLDNNCKPTAPAPAAGVGQPPAKNRDTDTTAKAMPLTRTRSSRPTTNTTRERGSSISSRVPSKDRGSTAVSHRATSKGTGRNKEERTGTAQPPNKAVQKKPEATRTTTTTTTTTTTILPQQAAQPSQEPPTTRPGLKPELPSSYTAISLPSPFTEEEAKDPQQCAEYVLDIYHNLLGAELDQVFRISPHLLRDQTQVEASHRRVLIDWLIQVHSSFGLLPDTLHVCLDILDRYLQVSEREPTLQI